MVPVVGAFASCSGAGSSAQGPTCPVILPPDTQANARAACTFGAGAKVADTLGIPSDIAKQIPIKNIVILMKENRSFDHLLGQIHDLQPGVEAVPASFANPDANGTLVTPFHATTTCIPFDPNHQWDAMHACVNNGAMDGFVKNAAAIKAKGVDTIAVTGVNDVFVMDAWKKASGGDAIEFLADGSGNWAKAVGLTADLSERGLGLRSQRYAMLVQDGVVKALNVEDAPGKAEISGADNILKAL